MKRLLAVLLTVAMALSMVSVAVADDVTNVTVWSIYTGDDFRIIQGVVDSFNEANPDVHIEHIAIAAEEMYTKMALVAGDDAAAPVVCIMHSYNIPAFAKQGILDPLEDFLSTYGDFSEDLYLSNDAGKVDGARYGIPFCAPTVVTYCNMDLANKYCPAEVADGIITWDELYAIADRMTAAGATDVKLLGGSWGRNDMINAYEQCGGTYRAEGDPDNLVTINKNALIEAVNLWKGLYDMGVTQQDGDDVMGMLALGELIFATGGTWNLSAVQEYGINYQMMPSIQKNIDSTYNWGATECIVKMHRNVTEAEQVATLRFMEYLRDNAIEWAKSGAIVMAKSTAESDEFKALPQSGAMVNGTETYAAYHVYAGAFTTVFDKLGFQAVYGIISPEEYADAIQVQCQQAIDGQQ
jgi:multiple sugar transport system substrate-binding protein